MTPGGPRLLVNMYRLASVVLKNRQNAKNAEMTVAEDALPSWDKQETEGIFFYKNDFSKSYLWNNIT